MTSWTALGLCIHIQGRENVAKEMQAWLLALGQEEIMAKTTPPKVDPGSWPSLYKAIVLTEKYEYLLSERYYLFVVLQY